MEFDLPTVLHDPVKFAAAGDPAGREWIAQLPALVGSACGRWSLQPDGAPSNGYHAIVIPVRRGNTPCALKCQWPPEGAEMETRALRVWNGIGAVELLKEDGENGVLLLERLQGSQSLGRLPLMDAAIKLGTVLRALTVPAPPGFPLLTDELQRLGIDWKDRQARLGQPIPDRTLEQGRALIDDLGDSITTRSLVHTDLHCGNVLRRSDGNWAAIDPKPVAGEPERSVPEMLWTRAHEVSDPVGFHELLATVTRGAELDGEKARKWAIVRSIDYWLWGLDAGLTHDPVRCRRVVEALLY